MAIYPDRKGGRLTGRFRVEVQGKLGRYRDRCATHALAKQREDEFIEMRGKGVIPPSARASYDRRTLATKAPMFSQARVAARGRVWRGMASEPGNLAALEVIEQLMGDTELNRINTSWAETLKERLVDQRGIQDQTVNRYMSALSKFLQWCVKKEYRTNKEHPEIPWQKEKQHRIRWITPEEQAKLQSVVEVRIAKVIRIAIRTGMRRGELLTVEPAQITKGWVHLWETKSGSPRSIPLLPEDEEDLRYLASGKMPSVEELKNAWRKARKAMGLLTDKHFVFHACRHTCATRLVQRNVNLRVIQKWLGHKDIKMTLRYAHVNDTMLTDALSALLVDIPAPTAPVGELLAA